MIKIKQSKKDPLVNSLTKLRHLLVKTENRGVCAGLIWFWRKNYLSNSELDNTQRNNINSFLSGIISQKRRKHCKQTANS